MDFWFYLVVDRGYRVCMPSFRILWVYDTTYLGINILPHNDRAGLFSIDTVSGCDHPLIWHQRSSTVRKTGNGTYLQLPRPVTYLSIDTADNPGTWADAARTFKKKWTIAFTLNWHENLKQLWFPIWTIHLLMWIVYIESYLWSEISWLERNANFNLKMAV